MTNDALRALDKIKSDVDGLFPKHTHGERFETIRAALAKNGCCDIDPDRCAGMCEDTVRALNKLGDSSSLPDIERNDCETIIRAALAPVDVDAGLRALDYQRDLALIFLVAKGSKDYDETIGDRIERVQELILQLKKQNDHLAARGCFVPEGYALVPIEPTREMILSGSNYYQKHGALSPCIPADIYKAMIKAAPKKELYDPK